MEQAQWLKAKKILCVRLDSLGDVLMTTPAFRAVKESTGAQLTLLTSPQGAAVAPYIPEVDQVISYASPWMKATAPRSDSREDHEMINRLRKLKFDAAIIFTVFSQNPLPAALTCFLADIPLRLAYSRENPYQMLTAWAAETEPEKGIRHEVRRHLDLVANVGYATRHEQLSMQVNEHDRVTAFMKLQQAGVDPGMPWVIIHPGASAPSRRYPLDGFAEVARQLQSEDHLQVVFTGVESECTLVDTIRSLCPGSFSLAGQLSLGEMAAVLSLSPLLISNNTGPVHIAAAVNTRVVVLYALTNPQHTPWAVPNRVLNHDVPCKFCYKSVCPELHQNCLRLVRPHSVVQAARELLRQPDPIGSQVAT